MRNVKNLIFQELRQFCWMGEFFPLYKVVKLVGGGEKKKKKKIVKATWRRQWRRGGIKKMLKSFLVAVTLSALVERCFVSRMRDFFYLAA